MPFKHKDEQRHKFKILLGRPCSGGSLLNCGTAALKRVNEVDGSLDVNRRYKIEKMIKSHTEDLSMMI